MRRALATILVLVALLDAGAVPAKGKPHYRIALSTQGLSWIEPLLATTVSAPLLDQVAAKVGTTYSLTAFKHTSELAAALGAGKYNVVICSQLEYVQISEKTRMIPLATEHRVGRSRFRLLLLVRSGSNIRRIEDLEGKSISVNLRDPVTEVYYRTLLARHGVKDPQRFFSMVKSQVKNKPTLLDVFLGKSDACIVPDLVLDSMARLNPSIAKKLRRLAASDQLVTGLIFVLPTMSQQDRARFRKTLLEIHKTERGKQTLSVFGTARLTSTTESDFDAVRKMWKAYQALQRQ